MLFILRRAAVGSKKKYPVASSQCELQDWKSTTKFEGQARVGIAQCLDGAFGGFGARENEAEIACPFGERKHFLASFGGDDNVLNALHRSRILNAGDADVNASARNGNHHYRVRSWLENLFDRFADGVAQNQFFERLASGEAQDPGTEASNRPRRDFEHPYSRIVDTHFGMNRAVGKTKRGYGELRGIGDRLLHRNRYVDGFLKKRTVERIGLIEQRQRL